MAQLYANENFPREAVEGLRALGHDVLTIQDAGNAGRRTPDAEVLRYASESGRAVITSNRRDFIRLHNESANHRGIIVCTEDLNFGRLAQRAHDQITAEGDLAGKLVRVVRPPT